MSIPHNKALSKVLVIALLSLLCEVSAHRLPLPLLKLLWIYYRPTFEDILDHVALEDLGLLIGIWPAILLLRHLIHAALLVLLILTGSLVVEMLLCEALIPLVQGPCWHAQLNLIDVYGPMLIADDHIVVGFDSDTLVASHEHSKTPDYLLLFLVWDLF